MGTTANRAIPGLDGGIFADFGLPELPKDFMILSSWHSITTTPTDDDNQKKIVVRDFHIQMHMEPRNIFGLVNFINAAVDSCSRFTDKN